MGVRFSILRLSMAPSRFKKPFTPPASPSQTNDSSRIAALTGTKALALLLIHEQAEEIKQTTICMRQVYPGCRVEAVYSAEEALEWCPKQDWGVILLDAQLGHRSTLDLLPALRRKAASSVIVVQAEHHDAKTAAKAIRAGADLVLYKKSPAFLTELPIVTRGVLEQRALQKELAAARERHASLIEHFPGLLYELDSDGRIVAIGAGVSALLGYSSQELTGMHYSTLLHPDEWKLARQHVHERRTASRAQHDKAVRLIGKHGGVVKIVCQTAGLYGQQRQYLGTIGIIESRTPGAALARPHEPSLHADPTPSPAPAVTEPRSFYPNRRRADRVSVQMEASLHLRDAAFPGIVRDISLSDVYVVVEGTPAVTREHPVRLDFFLEGAILQIHGEIVEVRKSLPSSHASPEPSGLGLVILYADIGTIEGPILSSLLEELRVQPRCARLTIFPSLSRNIGSH
jgi:PAS domain S-box-containing protein